MKIVAITFGTEGDTRPIVALCRGLIEAGHKAVLLAESSGASLANSTGVPFVALAGDIRPALSDLLSTRSRDRGGASSMAKALAGMAKTCTDQWMKSLFDEASHADALVFSGLTSYVGLSVAEYLRIPAIGAGLQPIVPTSEFGSPFLPWSVPQWCNRLSHRLVMAIMWRAFRGAINAARAEVTKQAPRQRAWRDYPILFGISPNLVPQPADWPEYLRITGYWHLASPHWQPPQPLSDFLAAGEPPIYVGFGSMVGFDRDRVLHEVVSALDGRRALLFSGWSGFECSDVPSNIFTIGPAPHDKLFPLVSMVIHHGGAGTSHTAVRAGVPSVVVPFAGDQFFWAGRLAKAGVAPESVPHQQLNARLLRQRIEEAQSVPIRERSACLGAVMRGEAGVATAVAAIETFVARQTVVRL